MSTVPYAFGWVEDKAAVNAVLGTLPFPTFSTTEAGQDTSDPPDHMFLWDAAKKVLGDILPPRNQGQVGSCVSFGTATAIEHTMLAEIAMGDPEEFKDLAQEVIYGGSRVEVGGGRIGGDGSVGAWAATFVQKWGVVARGKYSNYDLTKYSESTCRQFGSRGVPDDLEPEAKKHPVKGITQVKSWDEAVKALASGYGVAICSDVGFSMQRDSEGFARRQGSWAHCMGLIGYKLGSRPGGAICNSWGPSAHTGPTSDGLTPAGFWADAKVVDAMLRQGDSWAFSSVVGFPARKLNWYL
jgi:hypothetical protein